MLPHLMEARSGQNHDNKIAPQVNFNPTVANIMDMFSLWTGLFFPKKRACSQARTRCVFLSLLNNTFFSVLIIIFSNKSYFCFNYTKYFFHSCHEFFFSGTSNYFCNVYQELFFNWAVNYFSWYREFIFWSAIHCGPCIWSGLVRVFDFLRRSFWKLCKWRSAFKENVKAKHCQGKKRKRFHLSYKICQELVVCRWWWGFLGQRFNRGDYWRDFTTRTKF